MRIFIFLCMARTSFCTYQNLGNTQGYLLTGPNHPLLLFDKDPSQYAFKPCQIPITLSFKYFGIQITPRCTEFCHLEVSLLIVRFRDRMKLWVHLQVLLVGKVNLVKRFLWHNYCICSINTPMVIPLKVFSHKFEFMSLLLNSKQPKIKLGQKQRPGYITQPHNYSTWWEVCRECVSPPRSGFVANDINYQTGGNPQTLVNQKGFTPHTPSLKKYGAIPKNYRLQHIQSCLGE